MSEDVAKLAKGRWDWPEWALLPLAAINGFSGADGHKPEHYVAGAVFFGSYCIVRTLRAYLKEPSK